MSMIKRIENFTYKSFKNYSGPKEDFAPVNIIFGYNGCGKSSLTFGIEKQFIANYPESEYRKFDRYYIEINLLVSESDQEFKGVKVSFGENAQLDSKIQNLRNQIKDTKNINQNMLMSLENAKKLIGDIYKRNKNNLNINRKTLNIDNIDNVKKYYRNDYNKAVRQFNNFRDSNLLIGLNDVDDRLKQLPKLLSIQSHISSIHSNDCKYILESEFKNDDSIPSQVVLTWLEEGLNLHQDEDHTCKFCGSSINVKDIRAKIKNYKSNEYQKVQKEIADMLNVFNELFKKFNQWEDYYNRYEITRHYISKEKISSLNELNSNLLNMLKEKSENISLYMDSSIFLTHLSQLTKELEQLESNINKSIENEQDNLYTLKNNQELFVKGKIAKEILDSQAINDLFTEIDNYKKEIQEIDSENERIKSEIRILEEKMNDYGLFSELVNNVLSDLNLSFKLCLSSNKTGYFLKSVDNNQLLGINDISEGESNLLAFIYFYYELFIDEEQKNIRPEIKMILLDDPITSLDQNNAYYLLVLIFDLIDKIDTNNQQIFITTHVWEHYCQLLYKRKDNKIRAFEIIKENNESKLLVSKKNNITPYAYAFSQVYHFVKNGKSKIAESEIYDIPNTMRRVLEEFLSFKTSGQILAQPSNIDKILDLYKKALGEGKISNSKEHKLGTMLSVINILSHNTSKNLSQVHESAKFMLTFIKDLDKSHYDYLKNIAENNLKK